MLSADPRLQATVPSSPCPHCGGSASTFTVCLSDFCYTSASEISHSAPPRRSTQSLDGRLEGRVLPGLLLEGSPPGTTQSPRMEPSPSTVRLSAHPPFLPSSLPGSPSAPSGSVPLLVPCAGEDKLQSPCRRAARGLYVFSVCQEAPEGSGPKLQGPVSELHRSSWTRELRSCPD